MHFSPYPLHFFNSLLLVTLSEKLRRWVSGWWWCAFKATLVRQWVAGSRPKHHGFIPISIFIKNQLLLAAFDGGVGVGYGRLDPSWCWTPSTVTANHRR